MRLSAIARAGKVGLCAIAVALGITLPGLAQSATALPPAELGGLTYTNTDRILVAQASDSAQLIVRVQQLEEQVRSLNGQIDGLTFQMTQLQELVTRLQSNGGAAAVPQVQPQGSPEDSVPQTEIPAQGVQPLPGEVEFDPTFDDGSVGNSGDPLVGTGLNGGVDLATGQPMNLNYDPAAAPSGDADADAQFSAAFEALQSGDYQFAEDQFSQFLELYPDNSRSAEASSFLGDSLMQHGAYNEAADVLLEAYQKAPTGPRAAEILVKLGASVSGAGEPEVACRTFAQVDANFPSLSTDVASRLAAEKTKAQCPTG